MILGTGSHVGKSMVTAGLCRILSDEGLRVAPFKAQNMALNSAATPDGKEIGRAQALQAEASRTMPSVEMNPVLIKPSSDTTSQVVLLGKVWQQLTAADYFSKRTIEIFPIVLEAYQKLASQYDVMVLEGAGSPAEINLRDHDIVNMRMAKAANASCLLVGDIDRGGVFASLLGTLELLQPEERILFKGFLINKFRGDKNLLRPGIEMIEKRLGLPCLGVVPYVKHLGLEEEDSVAVEDRSTVRRVWGELCDDKSAERPLRIGVIALPHMANFTDFDALSAEPSVALAFIEKPADIDRADVLIIPGTKQTIADLEWLSTREFDSKIREHSDRNFPVIGVCGGFQMLGLDLADPHGVENDGVPVTRKGLGLLAVSTTLGIEKTTRPVSGRVCATDPRFLGPESEAFKGYEIHMGETTRSAGTPPFARLETSDGDEFLDGAISTRGLAFGTYVHGVFDTDAFRHNFIDWARAALKLAPAKEKIFATAERDSRLNRWADCLRESLQFDQIRQLIRK